MVQRFENAEIKKLKSQVVCPVELALRVLGGKWRGSILYQLRNGPLRFNELKLRVQDAVVEDLYDDNYLTNKVLSGHLHALVTFALIEKISTDDNSQYGLTAKGESVMPILLDLFYWGQDNF